MTKLEQLQAKARREFAEKFEVVFEGTKLNMCRDEDYPKILSFQSSLIARAFDAGRKSVTDELNHEQQKLLEGFAHPKDCQSCNPNHD